MAGTKQSTISRLLAGAGFNVGAAEADADEPAVTGATADQQAADPPPAAQVAETDAMAAVNQAAARATAAERTRWNAVLTSPEGKANSANAVFLLNTTGASADQVIGHLKDAPAAAAPVAPAAEPEKKDDAAAAAAATGASRQPTARLPVGGANGADTAHQEGDGAGDDQKIDGKTFWTETVGKGGAAMESSARIAAERSASQALGAGARGGH
jgi:hypothetical protein